MRPETVKLVLQQKGIKHLYHANTVVTSLTYINNGGLFSRSAATNLGLPQTPQESDEIDIEMDVYNDIFFDSDDIHRRAKKLNDYGPITFVYGIDLLDELQDYDICITRTNPIYWDSSMSESDKYFKDRIDLYHNFIKGNFKQHITIRNIDKPINFKYLEAILIDDPEMPDDTSFRNALLELSEAVTNNSVCVPITLRDCPDDCKCKEQYRKYKEGYLYYRFRTEL